MIQDDGKTLDDVINGKVLGIPWYESEDMLVMRLCDSLPHLDSSDKVTKRLILKTVASFYDPPGLIQHAVIKLKILFQEAWKLELDCNCVAKRHSGLTNLEHYSHSSVLLS